MSNFNSEQKLIKTLMEINYIFNGLLCRVTQTSLNLVVKFDIPEGAERMILDLVRDITATVLSVRKDFEEMECDHE